MYDRTLALVLPYVSFTHARRKREWLWCNAVRPCDTNVVVTRAPDLPDKRARVGVTGPPLPGSVSSGRHSAHGRILGGAHGGLNTQL
jgi:hypothetical protein